MLLNILVCVDFLRWKCLAIISFSSRTINAKEAGCRIRNLFYQRYICDLETDGTIFLNKNLFIRPLQRAPYFFAGVDRTFFSSISLFAALFFSALSCAFGGEFCGLRGLVTGSVAVLSPPAAASTSTVATLQSPPPTIVDFVLFHELLTIVKRCSTIS